VGRAWVDDACIFLNESDVSQGREEDALPGDVAINTMDVLNDVAGFIEDTTHADEGSVVIGGALTQTSGWICLKARLGRLVTGAESLLPED
jgi:hypothetical protein